MNALQKEFQTTQEMARLGDDGLKAFIKQLVEFDVPANLLGDTQEEKIELYINNITGLLQAAFPTETTAHIVAKVDDVHLNGVASSALARFINYATDTKIIPDGEKFDIRSTHIDTFVENHGDKIFASSPNDQDKHKIVAQVKRLQRLFQVSTSAKTFQSLIESKYNSANEIAQTPIALLKEEFTGKIDALDLELIHQRSMAAAAATLHLALQAYQSVTDTNPKVVGRG
jgi:hypothetical protein